jgi:gas vesicle protein
MKWTVFFWIPAALFLAGCAAAPTVIEKKEVAAPVIKPAEESPAAPPRLFEERDLLLDGVALLNLQDRPDPTKARSVFTSLIQRYPQSRWRSAAEAFIRLIDERDAFREVSHQDRLLIGTVQGEKAETLQESDRLKKTVRELMEKLQSETAALTQENERLKKDIERLKALEIELEKRERRLR